MLDWLGKRTIAFLLIFHQGLGQIINITMVTNTLILPYLSDPGIPGIRSMGPDVTHSVSQWCFIDFIDVTLVLEMYLVNQLNTSEEAKKAILALAMYQFATWWLVTQ